MRLVSVFSFVLAAGLIGLGCGGGDDTTDPGPDFGDDKDVIEDMTEDPGDKEDTKKPDIIDDPGPEDKGKDPGPEDKGDDPGKDEGDDPGKDEGDAPGKDEGGPEVDPNLECPCDESIVSLVCGTDEVTYTNDQCAKCAICKDDAVKCNGCLGTKDCDPANPLGDDGWIKQKADCKDCVCNNSEECAQKFFTTAPCGPLCDKQAVQFETPCEMKDAYDCSENYDAEVDYLGACK